MGVQSAGVSGASERPPTRTLLSRTAVVVSISIFLAFLGGGKWTAPRVAVSIVLIAVIVLFVIKGVIEPGWRKKRLDERPGDPTKPQ